MLFGLLSDFKMRNSIRRCTAAAAFAASASYLDAPGSARQSVSVCQQQQNTPAESARSKFEIGLAKAVDEYVGLDEYIEWAESLNKQVDVLDELGDGKIEQIRLWKCAPDAQQKHSNALKPDELPGRSRIKALVRLGKDICGHPQYVHGGFTAALLDDMLGWTTFLERIHLANTLSDSNLAESKIFTANLTVNYRRPVKLNGVYLVECKVARVERVKKIWLECTISDREGNVLVEGESLYIIKGIEKKESK